MSCSHGTCHCEEVYVNQTAVHAELCSFAAHGLAAFLPESDVEKLYIAVRRGLRKKILRFCFNEKQ